MDNTDHAHDNVQNPSYDIHQHRPWPFQCAICSGVQHDLKLFFAPTTYSDFRYICATPMDPSGPPRDDCEVECTPIIFTVIGQIAREDCFLTAAGEPLGGRMDHVQDSPLASCWLESHPDRDSRIEWHKLKLAVERVAGVAGGSVNTERVIRVRSNSNTVQLRVRFSPEEGDIKDTLPFFDTKRNTRCVPASVDEVPYDQPFRATFSLELIHEGEDRYLFADLFYLMNV